MAGRQKTMTGRVVSDKMDKTVVVMVQSTKRHRLYHKIMTRSKRYFAHDEGDAKPGDLVRIEETRPTSRHKRWRVAEILRRGEVAEIAPREIDSEYLSKEREVQAPAPPPPREEPIDERVTDEAVAGDAEADAAAPAEVATQEPEASAEADEEPDEEAVDAEETSDEDADEEPAAEAANAEETSDEDAGEEPAQDSDDNDSTTTEEEEQA